MGRSQSESKENETEKTKKLICSKFRCPNCGELGHRKKARNALVMVPRKGKSFKSASLCDFL
jgi:hypothetical protein